MDKVALITGATSAIGAATARLLSQNGYAVGLAGRRLSQLEALAREIEAKGGQALAIEADVTQSSSTQNMVQKTLERFGGLDVAFNNAGGGTRPKPLADVSPEEFSESLSVNLTGTFLSMRDEIKAMLARGAGAIVNMSSTAGLQGVAGLAPYCAGKHAVIGLSKAAALDYADKCIRINVVAPGPIATERIDPEQRKRIGKFVPVGRVGQPDEVAAVVHWLSSNDAQFITGIVVPIDGGRLAGVPSFAIES